MSTPRFAVGEVVYANHRDDEWAECTVTHRFQALRTARSFAGDVVQPGDWLYQTDYPDARRGFLLGGGLPECCLRKRHQPGELSYEELLRWCREQRPTSQPQETLQ